jgi:hypothetical protein
VEKELVEVKLQNTQLQDELKKVKKEKILLEKNKRATDFLPTKRFASTAKEMIRVETWN